MKKDCWVVCSLKADRSVAPEKIQGTFGNGAKAHALQYPVRPIPEPEQFGIHTTRDNAVRALALTYHQDLFGSPIEHLKRVCKDLLNGKHKTYAIKKWH